ncbi:hypothetical protein [Mongoliibacter ruber]|uniref:Uncharacterized protein n=1 Tax=Mongoliibacter ruber TaxID=1750599 RepID=A0A2T0WP10_9BACT|nr:hypothetical protein [Mongoliibacter ruber]PRY88429.1 hypothetical protein CLW00_10480 [Mongoliibacter ruber]
MIKSFVLAILTSLVVLFLGKLAPYWVLMLLVSLLAIAINPRPWPAFFAAGFAFGLTWFVLTIWISVQSESNLPEQMAVLMGVKSDNFLWLVTGILGYLIGGFSAMTGSLFRKIFERKDMGIYRS